MKKEEFFPKAKLVGKKLILNSEAIETMDLDVADAKVILIQTENPEKQKNNKEILIMKTNGSLCDDPENIKDVFSPESIRKVSVESKDGEIISGSVDLSEAVVKAIADSFGNDTEFKLLVCNTESPLGKEFKEQFDITSNYYRFADITDKRTSIGKDKNVKENTEQTERVSIN
jgi:hypothetical protein